MANRPWFTLQCSRRAYRAEAARVVLWQVMVEMGPVLLILCDFAYDVRHIELNGTTLSDVAAQDGMHVCGSPRTGEYL